MSSDENTEVIGVLIGGAPELGLPVIVMAPPAVAVLFGCAVVVWGVGSVLNCGVALSGAGWVVGGTLDGSTLDVGGGAADVDVLTVVGGFGVVDTTTGVAEVVGVTRQRRKVWSAIDQ